MLENYDDPWRISCEAINARAWWYLENSARLPPSVSRGRPFHGIPRLRLWDDAIGLFSEAGPTSWTVFELFTDTHAREPVVRRAIWKRTEDLRKLHDEVQEANKVLSLRPTISVRDVPVPEIELADFLSQAASFHVPIAWLDDDGMDITDVGSVGFEFLSRDQPPAVLRLQWSAGRPACWERIDQWYCKMRDFLEGSLSQT